MTGTRLDHEICRQSALVALDPGFLERLANRGLGDGLAEIDRAAGSAPQFPLSVRRIIRMLPASLTTTILTGGTRL